MTEGTDIYNSLCPILRDMFLNSHIFKNVLSRIGRVNIQIKTQQAPIEILQITICHQILVRIRISIRVTNFFSTSDTISYGSFVMSLPL